VLEVLSGVAGGELARHAAVGLQRDDAEHGIDIAHGPAGAVAHAEGGIVPATDDPVARAELAVAGHEGALAELSRLAHQDPSVLV